MRPVELIAHRAGNRIGGVEAVAGVADTVELDLRPERGGLVVRHPRRIWFTSRLFERSEDGRFHLLPRGESALSFDEAVAPVIAAGAGSVIAAGAGSAVGLQLWIDGKGFSPRHLPRAVDRARGLGQGGTITVSSKAWWMLALRPRRPGRGDLRVIRSVSSNWEMALLTRLPSRVEIDGVVARSDLLTATRVSDLKRRFGSVFSWSIHDSATAERLIDHGVDGLIIDDPELLATLR